MSGLARYYKILGLEAGASPDEIKESWRDLAQVWHPDRFGDNERLRKKAQEKLKEVNEAYQALRKGGDGAGRSSTETRSTPASAASRRAESDGGLEIDQRELLLKEGVNVWNIWRKKYSDVRPDLHGANLRKADLSAADLREANLSGAFLQGADLYKANLSGANLKGAKLSNADLSRATLIDVNLTQADLERADLSSADLSSATLSKANLAGVNLVGAILEGADLSTAVGLTREQIAEALTDRSTRLPPHLKI